MTSRAEVTIPERLPLRHFAWRRAALTFAITLLALLIFGAVFAATYAALHAERVLPGISVGGVALAGLDRDEAEAKLRNALPDLDRGSLTVSVGAQSDQIDYAELDRDYDMERMLDQAFAVGRGGAPFEQLVGQIRTMLDGVAVPVSASYDAQRLVQRVTAFAVAQEAPAVDATLSRREGAYVVNPSAEGQSVDEQRAAVLAVAALDNLSAADTRISVDPVAVPPAVTTAQVQAAADRANAVADSRLAMSAAGETVTVDAATINGWVRLEETGPGSWELMIEAGPIGQIIDALKEQVDVPAINAGWHFEGGRVVATPATDGTQIDREAAVGAVLEALRGRAEGEPGSTVNLAMVPLAPDLTTAQAQSLASQVVRLSRWTTRYQPSVSNGFGQNIRRPANLIDGTVVQPGEEFDFVEVAGPITKGNGYTDGAAIIHGNTQLDGVLGGGLCSASTTIFNAALRAGFEMGARRNHAYFIDRYPVGLDATIWINGSYVQTMSFTNDTEYPILIRGINRRGAVEFQIWGVPDGREVSLSKARVWNEREAWTRFEYTDELAPGQTQREEFPFAGFNSEVTRTVTTASGTVLHEDVYRSNYRRVIGKVLVGRGEGDPPAGTILEPNKPSDS